MFLEVFTKGDIIDLNLSMEEYIDVLDPSGKPTGEKKDKKEIHRVGDWHRAAHVWIINPKGELLIQRRSASIRNHPNKWDISAAGHVSSGESSLVCAKRETKEELGLDVPDDKMELLFSVSQETLMLDGTYINKEYDDIYLVSLNFDPTSLTLQKTEVAEVKFISFRELEKIVNQGDKEYVSHPAEYAKLFAELHRRF